MPLRVFVDSDVIISSLISKTGAAYFLMNDTRFSRFVSDVSVVELIRVASELKLSQAVLRRVLKTQCVMVPLDIKREIMFKRLNKYTRDANDSHVVAGAKAAKAQFLVTYNTKHFQTEKIREELGITVLPPAFLLQYLRSLN